MLDLAMIRQRAATRATVANAANRLIETPEVGTATPANPANRLIDAAEISQLATLARVARGNEVRSCASCRHRSRVATCRAPVAAGLLAAEDGFGITWPPEGHGAGCEAWAPSPARAIVAVMVAAVKHGWSEANLRAWLADADQHPDAVIDLLGAAC